MQNVNKELFDFFSQEEANNELKPDILIFLKETKDWKRRYATVFIRDKN